ncbi:MAG: hypothetical protein NVSMB25_14310 [Thermoleophilaceae bacterium]
MPVATRITSISRALRRATSRWSAAIAAITLVGALLRLTALGGSTTNAFYDAAVRSMSESWHNFFFAAFEPGGGVSIDKPPVDLWAQVASVKLFGFGATSLILPQALAATAAIPLLYDLVRRMFGRPSGLAAALALAVLPVSVLTARSDTMDSLMMALNVMSAWLVLRAAESGRARLLVVAAAVMGLNFEVKLFEALLALPALAALYAFAAHRPLRDLLRPATAATAVFLIAALAWPVAVSLTPRSSRPYPIGSTNGSVWNAIFVYNGLDRLNPPRYNRPTGARPGVAAAVIRPVGALSSDGHAPGPLRLFALRGDHFGQDLGIELLGALAFGLVAALWRGREMLERRRGDPGAVAAVAGAVTIAVWLIVCVAVFSRTRGVLHSRYLEAMTPAVATGLGAGCVACARLARERTPALVATIGALALAALYALDVAGADTPIRAAVIAVAVGGAAALLVSRLAPGRPRALAPLLAAVLMLAVPLAPALARSLRMVRTHASDAGGTGSGASRRIDQLGSYLARHNGAAFYELAAYAYPQASRLIVRDGRPVLVLMSFHRPVVTVGELARQVAAGRVRHALIGGHCGIDPVASIGDCPATIRWLRRRATDVGAQAGLPEHGFLFRIDRAA